MAYSATNTVTSHADNGPGSLRQVIQNSAPGDSIMFSVTGTIVLANGELALSKNLTIRGPGASALTISANSQSRILNVNPSANVFISDVTISSGRAANGTTNTPGQSGGGIYNAGTLLVSNCVIKNNSAGQGAYGTFGGDNWGGSGSSGGDGGGIYNDGALIIFGSTISGNTAGDGGGGGSGHYYGGGAGGGGSGGGICGRDALIINCTFANNRAGNGGNGGSGQVGSGGGAAGGKGGGVYAFGNLTMSGCTVVSNSAGRGGSTGNPNTGGNGGMGGAGGGIYIYAGKALWLTNCTFASNSGGGGGVGGGRGSNDGDGGNGGAIYGFGTIVACTIVSNSAGFGYGMNGTGGGIYGGTILLDIVALNSGTSPDVAGCQSLGHNLVGVTNGNSDFFSAPGDLVGSATVPLNHGLGPLADNGGPTWTMALLPGSPAIDAGSAVGAPPTDQRGLPRPAGVQCDIGAYEWNPPSLTIPPPTQTAEIGTTVELMAKASTFTPATYQWFFNGNAITGCTNSVLCLSGVQATNVGAYTLVVRNIDGVKTSSPAMLNVIPVVERRPVPGVNVAGEAGSLFNVDYANSLSPSPNWSALGSVTLTSTSQFCPELTMPLPAARFYRAWQTGTPAVLPSLNLNFVPAIKLTGNAGDSLHLDWINAIGPTNAWVTLDAVTLTNTSQLYFDVTAPGQPQRLYRIMPNP